MFAGLQTGPPAVVTHRVVSTGCFADHVLPLVDDVMKMRGLPSAEIRSCHATNTFPAASIPIVGNPLVRKLYTPSGVPSVG